MTSKRWLVHAVLMLVGMTTFASWTARVAAAQIGADHFKTTPVETPVGQQDEPVPPQPSSVAPAPATSSGEGGAVTSSFDLTVEGTSPWVDTQVDLLAGDTLACSATGTIKFAANSTGPQGLPRSWIDLITSLPVNSVGRGALVGRIGDDQAALPFLVGASAELKAPRSGRFFLGFNYAPNETADGSFTVKCTHTRIADATGGAVPATFEVESMSDLPADLLEKIPRRVQDADGHPGDMVNFLIVGSEEQMKQAFAAAGWVLVDRTKEDAVIHGILSVLTKQAYVELPMSDLYLFGRSQDFGFAHAEPIKVVASRHHLRIWKSDQQVNGEMVWVGAATHDIGFDRDQRNGGVTHKIDPAVDDERKFVRDSLESTGIVSALIYLVPSDPLAQANTATGGSFHSDGRVLVLRLATASAQ